MASSLGLSKSAPLPGWGLQYLEAKPGLELGPRAAMSRGQAGEHEAQHCAVIPAVQLVFKKG